MRLILIYLFCLMPVIVHAQNGRLISSTAVEFPDSASRVIDENQVLRNIRATTNLNKITYWSDSLRINGYLATPKKTGNYPVIIFNRGGNRDFGALDDHRAMRLLCTMASWGYTVLASNYRGGGGSEGRDEFGGSDVNDILNLIPLIAHENLGDTMRMGIYGFSRGGMMTYLLLRQSCAFKAAIIGAGASNLFTTIRERPGMETYVFAELIPDYADRKKAALEKRSAIYWADELCKKTPLMLMHGSSDWRVAPSNSLEMVDKLYALKHPVRFLFLEGADHGLSEHRSLVWDNVREFFDAYVKNGRPFPDMTMHGK